MKKILRIFMLLCIFVFSLAGCGNQTGSSSPVEPSSPIEQPVTKHTVQFYVEDELYKTMKVEDGTAIGASNVSAPVLEGFSFVSWVDKDNNVIDLDTHIIEDALKLYATFEEVITDDTLIVNGVKDAGVDYYFVVGWWEVVGTNDDGTPKVTSSLTPDTVRVFYANLILYLQAAGATQEQIDNIQFRDYSSATVAEMGEMVNTDADVDLLIGVGNNINSTANVELFEGNDGKQDAVMGVQQKSRKVALPNHEVMNPLAISVFDWIKTEVGQKSFINPLKAEDIVVVPERTDEISLKVTVHGLVGDPVITNLTSKKDEIAVPQIELEQGYKFLGYALENSATEADITVGLGVALTYAQVMGLLNDASELTLYPVVEIEVIDTDYDLTVYVHSTSSTKISLEEVELFKDRFEATLEEPQNINYVVITEGAAADFLALVQNDIANGVAIDVVIGGNATTKNLTAIDTTYVNVSCDPSHFNDTSRKVIVLNSCVSTHEELAKQLYTFATSPAPELALTFAYWHKENSWVTAEEIAAITDGITQRVNTLFAIEDAYTVYNITISFYSCTSTKVADLSTETKALNDGKGVGMIIGTGGNATDDDKMGSAIIEQKDCPTSIVANERKVAICIDNVIYNDIYNNYFAEVE